ncbi:MAG TPA: hypothetical protein VF765_34360 [Polyangiaceae bacterium]
MKSCRCPRNRLGVRLVLGALVVASCPAAAAQTRESIEHTFIVGVGGAGELELADGSIHPGANVMLEWDAIEDWLELEIGASILAIEGAAEVPIDLLIKKPFRLGPWSEFMIGVGPEVVRVTGGPDRGTYFGGEVALDFMFWPWGRRVGLWVEPEYDLVFHNGASGGIGTTGGVLLGW